MFDRGFWLVSLCLLSIAAQAADEVPLGPLPRTVTLQLTKRF